MALSVGTNSYVTNAEADTYLEDSLRSGTWDAADETTQDQALVTAYRMLERQAWQGDKTGGLGQTQAWPRTGLSDADGNAIADDSVPQFVKDAQVELALALLVNQNVETQSSTGSDVKRAKAGSAEVEFFSSNTSGTRFPTVVHELIGRYLASAVGLEGPTIGGLLAESGVEDYGLGRGI